MLISFSHSFIIYLTIVPNSCYLVEPVIHGGNVMVNILQSDVQYTKIGGINRSQGNPRALALITKWIWSALVISPTLLVEKKQLLCTLCSGLHSTMDFSFSQFSFPVVCPPAMWTCNCIASNILISRIPLFYYYTLHSSSFILLPHIHMVS